MIIYIRFLSNLILVFFIILFFRCGLPDLIILQLLHYLSNSSNLWDINQIWTQLQELGTYAKSEMTSLYQRSLY
jgi:hypothetical protein